MALILLIIINYNFVIISQYISESNISFYAIKLSNEMYFNSQDKFTIFM